MEKTEIIEESINVMTKYPSIKSAKYKHDIVHIEPDGSKTRVDSQILVIDLGPVDSDEVRATLFLSTADGQLGVGYSYKLNP